MFNLLDWFTKKRIIIIIGGLLSFILLIIVFSSIKGLMVSRKFSTFNNNEFLILQPKTYKSATLASVEIVLSNEGVARPKGDSITVSSRNGKYDEESLEQLRFNSTTQGITGEPLDQIKTSTTSFNGNPALLVVNEKPRDELYSTSAFIFIDEKIWKVELKHRKDGLLASNSTKIFKSLAPVR